MYRVIYRDQLLKDETFHTYEEASARVKYLYQGVEFINLSSEGFKIYQCQEEVQDSVGRKIHLESQDVALIVSLR